MTVRMLLAVLSWACLAPTAGAGDFALETLADGIHVHLGAHADLDSPARADSANLAYIEGDDCLAVIDSGGSQATGAAFANALRARSAKPVCYLINTHVHFDHVLGNAALVGPTTRIVGHAALAAAIETSREFFAEAFGPELAGAAVRGPQILVEDQLELDLGGRKLRLVAHPAAHTQADLTVLDVATGTLFAGDLVSRERLPVLDGSLLGWIAWLEQAMREDHPLVVPGHGAPDAAWPHGARALLAYLTALRDETRRAIAAAVFIEDAKGVVAKDALPGWVLTERAHPLNVSRAYRELEWE